MSIDTNFNTNPYFDDYNDQKDFLRILFRPGYAVQARELTQLQTILQKQVERFGNHIFEEGSPVLGGQLTIDVDVTYIKMFASTDGIDINVNDYFNKKIIGRNSGAIAKVVYGEPTQGSDNPTLFVKVLNGIDFEPNELVDDEENTLVSRIFTGSTSIGVGSLAHIDAGVYYTKGFFVRVDSQTISLNKYDNLPSLRVGLTIDESIIDEDDDNTLLDPANGSFNFTAPGAHRFSVSLKLDKKQSEAQNFIELARLENGVIQRLKVNPLYSELGKQIAKRTYDESGNYTVRPFQIDIVDHPSDSSKYRVELDNGKAYVKGYEYETMGTDFIDGDRARDVNSIENQQISVRFGNYVIISNINGLFDTNVQEEVPIHSIPVSSIDTTSQATIDSTKIGTAKIVAYRKSGSSVRMYVRDVRFNTIEDEVNTATANTVTFTNASSASSVNDSYVGMELEVDGRKYPITGYTASTNTITVGINFTTIPANGAAFKIIPNRGVIESFVSDNGAGVLNEYADIDILSKENQSDFGQTLFFESSASSLIFPTKDSYISTLRATAANANYIYQKQSNISFSSGVGTLTSTNDEFFPGTGAALSPDDLSRFILVVTNAQTSGRTVGEIVPITSGSLSPDSRTLTVETGVGTDTFTGEIVALYRAENSVERSKTLIQATTPTAVNSVHLATSSELARLDLGQRLIENPNKIPGQKDSLLTADVLRIQKIVDIGKIVEDEGIAFEYANTATWEAYTHTHFENSAYDITANYRFDDGQKDYLYDHASISLVPGKPAPIGPIVVYFDYFDPGSIGTQQGYFSVDSYSAIDYGEIPTFTSKTSGKTIRLSDAIDFRPVRAKNSTNFDGGLRIPEPSFTFDVDYQYYMGRIDKVVLTKDRQLKILKGVSSDDPRAPMDLDSAMTLYILNLPPYTADVESITNEYIDNQRYTMRDIGDMEKRIKALELHAIMSKLESDTMETVVFDDFGNEKFINGALIDNFSGHAVGDVENVDYRISIDFSAKELRPSFEANAVDLNLNDVESSNYQRSSNGIITLPYEETNFIDQSLASKVVNVNPYNVANWNGSVTLSPERDVWMERVRRPAVTVNISGDNDAWERIGRQLEDERRNGFGTEWNDWQTRWTGVPQTTTRVLDTQANASVSGRRLTVNTRTTTEKVTTRRRVQFRTGTVRTLGVNTIRRDLGTRVVDTSVVPFIRSRTIQFTIRNAKPNTDLYAFFDGKDVNSSISADPGFDSVVGCIKTNPSGFASGTFTIPGSTFRTGTRVLRFINRSDNNVLLSTSKAEGSYSAEGTRQTTQQTVGLIRQPVIRTQTVTETRPMPDVVTREQNVTETRQVRWIDPLAQSFLINSQLYPNGMFLTSVDLWFATKDSGLPVTVQIRPTVNGYPSSSIIVPGSEVQKLPSEVITTETPNLTNLTKFTFDNPVYLEPGEYTIVVLSNSNEYNLYVGEMGQISLDGNLISENPYAGVMFKSQNASTWTAVQEEDMMFRLNRASFDTNVTGSLRFDTNSASIPSDLVFDTFQAIVSEYTNTDTNIDYFYDVDFVGGGGSGILPYTPNDNIIMRTPGEISSSVDGSFKTYIQLSTNSEIVSPVIDEEAMSLIAVKNIIDSGTIKANNVIITNPGSGYANTDTFVVNGGNGNGATGTLVTDAVGAIRSVIIDSPGTNYTEKPTVTITTSTGIGGELEISSELDNQGGNGVAKYITRPMTLAQNFDANDLQVRFDAYRPVNSNIDVYYKVLSGDDSDDLSEKNYVKMKLKEGYDNFSENTEDFREYIYEPIISPITYTDSNGNEYPTFKSVAIKIVLRSNGHTYFQIPRIRDFKALAFAP